MYSASVPHRAYCGGLCTGAALPYAHGHCPTHTECSVLVPGWSACGPLPARSPAPAGGRRGGGMEPIRGSERDEGGRE
eukprot:1388869-Rhodomonas_salina.1